jgi:hypothetical protein
MEKTERGGRPQRAGGATEREKDEQPRWGAMEMPGGGRCPNGVKNAEVARQSAVTALRWRAF